LPGLSFRALLGQPVPSTSPCAVIRADIDKYATYVFCDGD
jgi:hypothetical protein